MNEPEVFVLANRTLNKVVAQIADDQWGMRIPNWFATGRSQRGRVITLREIIAYHAYDDAWVPDMLAGRTMDDVGADKFDGELLGDSPAASFAALVDASCAAAEAVTNLDQVVHCSFGDYSMREYFWQVNSFRAFRARDIAKVIGAPDPWADELVQGIWEEVSPHADEWREIGVFPAAVEVPSDAPLRDRLLAITGRRP